MPPNSGPMKTYNLYYTLCLNVTFHLGSSSTPAVYYGEACCLNYVTKKPQLILHHGSSKSAPVVAAAKLHTTSRDVQLCLGDHEKNDHAGGTVVWEDMHRDKTRIVRGDYVFSTALGSVDGAARRTYSWKRDTGKVGRTVYTCVDDQGQVVARMASGGMLNWKKAAEIDVAEGLGEAMETLLLVGAGSIFWAEAGWSFGRGYEKGGAAGEKGVS